MSLCELLRLSLVGGGETHVDPAEVSEVVSSRNSFHPITVVTLNNKQRIESTDSYTGVVAAVNQARAAAARRS